MTHFAFCYAQSTKQTLKNHMNVEESCSVKREILRTKKKERYPQHEVILDRLMKKAAVFKHRKSFRCVV